MNHSHLATMCNSTFTDLWAEISSPDQKRMLLLGIISAGTTLNDIVVLNEWLPKCKGVLHQEAVEETILQTLLFAGFPKTIEALKQLRKHYPQSSGGKQVSDHQKAGLDTSKLIYGKHHSRLIQVMDELHPDLTRWMIEDGYGRVLSRPGLSIKDRELAVIASLMASGMVHQFKAHIRGALYAGVSKVDTIWFTNTFVCIIADDLKVAFGKVRNEVLDNQDDNWGVKNIYGI
ncbi:MAG: carboxymuconolactone decarboxylase family protein [Candidatus Marinimicrobia bacterium]|nr:carboxymuconolactone decarboxylase family protein [Candidatus Neomarinimicrobiota bacterium]